MTTGPPSWIASYSYLPHFFPLSVKVDDLTALAVAEGVLTSPTVRPAR